MKKVVSLFMALLMIFSVAAPSFAVSATELAEASYASDVNAGSTPDDAITDAIEGVVDFFTDIFNKIINFFKKLFGLDNGAGKYKIVFNTDGGNKMNPMTVAAGDEIPSPDIPVKTGHTFIGWSPALPEIMPKYDIEVKALWSVNKYTINFDSNYGTNVEPITQNYGTLVEKPSDPVRSGYEFKGWYDNKGDLVSFPFYMPAYNFELTAHWLEASYSIVFKLNATDKDAYFKITGKKFNEVIKDSEKPEDPTLEGHTFIGWSHPIPERMPSKNMEIVAVWAEKDYTVSFVADGKTLPGFPLTNKYGTVFTVPSAPAKEGHTFAGWTDANGNSISVSPAIKADVTYYAKYTPNTYNISWNIDSGKSVTKSFVSSITFGSYVQVPSIVTKEGYTFKGWDKTVPSTMPAENLSFTAQFEAKDVTITFVNAITGETIKTITQDYESSVTTPPSPTMEGHTFTGWAQEIPSKMPANDITIEANFKVNQYSITFKDTGDVTYPTIRQNYGTEINKIVNPVKEGHTFLNWDKSIPTKMPAENLVITAQWKVNQYTIKFDTNGGSAIAPVTQNYGTALAAPATPVKSDYEFIGWAKVANPSVDDKITLPSTIPAENVTFYAIWRGAPKTVVFNANGGTFYANDEYTSSKKHTRVIRNGDNIGEYVNGEYEIDGVIFPQPTKDGYAVLYWSTDSTAKADMSNKIPDVLELDKSVESVEYFAQWAPTHTITLIDGLTNETLKEETLPEGASLAGFFDAAQYEENKDGYNLVGWAEKFQPTLEDKVNPFTVMPKKNLVYYAIWDAKEYVLAFDAMGGQIKDTDEEGEEIVLGNPYFIKADYLADLTNTEDDIADLPNTPVREGFIFMGWTTKKGYDYEDIEALIKAEEDNAKAENPVELEVTLSSITATIPEKMPLAGAYYYAMWIRNTYNAEYYIVSEDGKTETLYEFDAEIEDEIQHKVAKYATKYNTAIEIPEVDPTRDGYQFMGWYDTKEATGGKNVKDIAMPANDIKLYARFEKTYTFTFANCMGVNNITAIYGTDIASQLKALAPEKEGHSFDYWNGSDDKKYTSNDAIAAAYPTMPKKNITFTAEWVTNTYKIVFVTDGGSAIDPIEQLYNTPVTAPDIPVKTGYTFGGWEPAVPDRMPAGGATCVAKWNVNQYTITFDTDGGTEVAPITQDYNTAVEAPEAPTKYGYVFTGWVNEDGVKVSVPSTMPANNTTLKATWTLGQFTAYFYANLDDKTPYETVIGKNTEAIVAPVDPSKDGYKFAGWSSDGKNVLADLGVFSSDVSFYAVWEANTIKIQFVDLDGKNLGEPIEQTCGEGYKTPDEYAPTKTGHTLGWMNGKAVVDMSKGVPCLDDGTELTYSAYWQINKYTITFVTGEDASEVAPITQDYNTELKKPADPTKTGYTFTGWTIDTTRESDGLAKEFAWKVAKVDKDGNAVTDNDGNIIMVPAKLDKDYILYANWVINEYTATFDAFGGAFDDGETVKKNEIIYNEPVAAPAKPSREGYTFKGWTPNVPDNMPASNITFKAVWEIITNEAVFDANDGKFIVEGKEEDYVSFKYDFGETITIPSNIPVKEGYNFIGWASTANATDVLATLGDMPAGSVTFYAVYEIKKDLQYTVDTYVMDTEGNYKKAHTGKRYASYGESVNVTPAEVEEGLYLDASMSELTATVEKTDTVVLKIYLARKQFTVSIEGENLELGTKTGKYYYGAEVSEPVLRELKEYEQFEGWVVTPVDESGNATGESTSVKFAYTVKGNVTITANITVKKWRLDFSTDGGSYIESISGVPYGANISSKIAAVKDPDKEGYGFGGWTYVDENGQFVPVDSSLTMPNKNFNLTAKWIKNS